MDGGFVADGEFVVSGGYGAVSFEAVRGLVTRAVDPSGVAVDYFYDVDDNLVSTKNSARTTWIGAVTTAGVRPTTTFGYDTFGNPTHHRDVDGQVTSATCDKMDRATSVTLARTR